MLHRRKHSWKQMQPEQAEDEVEDGSVVDDGSMADAENEAAARYKATATVLAAAGKGVRSCEYTMDIG